MTATIDSFDDLMKALAQREPCNLQVRTSILSPYSIPPAPRISLTGKNKDTCILGVCNGDGIGLTE